MENGKEALQEIAEGRRGSGHEIINKMGTVPWSTSRFHL